MKKLLLIACIIGCSFNLSAQTCNDTLPVLEDFTDPNVINVCWNLIDQDGDSNDWYWWEYSASYGGHKVIASNSFYTSTGALTPDNWIISHAIDLSSFNNGDSIELSWKVRGELVGFAHENYTIYAAADNQISAFESSPVKRSEYVDEVGGEGTFVTRTLDISSLAGSPAAYIAFRHHNSTDQYNINIDDVAINSSLLGINDLDENSFKHFYNIDSNVLTLKSSNRPIDHIEIFNILGQRTLTKKLFQTSEAINLSSFKDGIYIARLTIYNSTKTIKFLKQ